MSFFLCYCYFFLSFFNEYACMATAALRLAGTRGESGRYNCKVRSTKTSLAVVLSIFSMQVFQHCIPQLIGSSSSHATQHSKGSPASGSPPTVRYCIPPGLPYVVYGGIHRGIGVLLEVFLYFCSFFL